MVRYEHTLSAEISSHTENAASLSPISVEKIFVIAMMLFELACTFDMVAFSR